jgi:membrane protein implicated in regulation of membrane protease activity
MYAKFVSRQNVIVILGAVMIVCLALTIVTGAVALIWIGQPVGNAAGTTADAFAFVFSVAFIAAFALAMAGHQPRNNKSHEEEAGKDTKHP